MKYNERISVNHKEITDEELSKMLKEIDNKVIAYNKTHKVKVKEFEVVTTLALIYFAKKQCDFVVLETGLGGKYDCTNIAKGMISIFTDIGLDHMDILGNTVEEITKEKAGIIKENQDTIMYEQGKIAKIIKDVCQAKKNTFHLAKKPENEKFQQGIWQFDYRDYHNISTNLKGRCQVKNASLVLECVEVLKQRGYKIGEKAVRKGLNNVIHKGRFEKLQQTPEIIFDGGHNENAIQNLREMIKNYYPKENKLFVVSLLKSKDYQTVIKLLAEEKNSILILTGRK